MACLHRYRRSAIEAVCRFRGELGRPKPVRYKIAVEVREPPAAPKDEFRERTGGERWGVEAHQACDCRTVRLATANFVLVKESDEGGGWSAVQLLGPLGS